MNAIPPAMSSTSAGRSTPGTEVYRNRTSAKLAGRMSSTLYRPASSAAGCPGGRGPAVPDAVRTEVEDYVWKSHRDTLGLGGDIANTWKHGSRVPG